MYHTRAIEEAIRKLKQQFPILLLTGPRQVGKSTLLNWVAQGKYRAVTMDDPILRREVSLDPPLFLKNNPPPLLIDEVQYTPELFPYLKMLVGERQQDGLVLMIGSQAFAMMRHVSESLAGRVGILLLQGLSLREMRALSFNLPFVPDAVYLEARSAALVPYGGLWDVIHRGLHAQARA